MAGERNCDVRTLCGISPLLVVCTYAPPDGECFYPSGPCRYGRENRQAALAAPPGERIECCGTSGYAIHLHPGGKTGKKGNP